MFNQIKEIEKFSNEICCYKQDLLSGKGVFMKKLALKQEVENSISLALIITATEFYKKGTSMFHLAKSFECFSENDYNRKIDLAQQAQIAVEMSKEIFEIIYDEDLPRNFETIKGAKDCLQLKSILFFMNYHNFDIVSSLIEELYPYVNVNQLYIDSVKAKVKILLNSCENFKSLDLTSFILETIMNGAEDFFKLDVSVEDNSCLALG